MMKLLPLLVIIFLTSCHKTDVAAPVINISSPTNNQLFTAGQTITIHASITDDQGIHMIHLIVTDNYGTHLIHYEEHWDGKNYELNKAFTTQAGKSYTINIDATDHADNLCTRLLQVTAG